MAAQTKALILRFARERDLHTLTDVARSLGITRQSASLLYKGQRTMSAETAMAVCDALQLDLRETLKELHAERESRSKKRSASEEGGDPGKLMPRHLTLSRRLHRPRIF